MEVEAVVSADDGLLLVSVLRLQELGQTRLGPLRSGEFQEGIKRRKSCLRTTGTVDRKSGGRKADRCSDI